MPDTSLTVLVTGASGFVGSHLARALVEEGHDVRAMTRRPEDYDGPGNPVAGDMSDPDSLVAALEGVDAAYYLVHSLDSQDFEKQDAEAARAFAVAAAQTGVKQIVYLGGLGAEDGDLSPHLRSRRQVEALLGEGGVPVTVLRAAIVVGHGGISWEITRQLVKNLPAMVAPHWVGGLVDWGEMDIDGPLVNYLDYDDVYDYGDFDPTVRYITVRDALEHQVPLSHRARRPAGRRGCPRPTAAAPAVMPGIPNAARTVSRDPIAPMISAGSLPKIL